MYNVYVEDFMVRDVKYIFHSMTYEELKQVLKENRKLQSFPLVDKPDSMILLGSIQRMQLIQVSSFTKSNQSSNTNIFMTQLTDLEMFC